MKVLSLREGPFELCGHAPTRAKGETVTRETQECPPPLKFRAMSDNDSEDSGRSSPRWVPVALPRERVVMPKAETQQGDVWRRVMNDELSSDWLNQQMQDGTISPLESLRMTGLLFRRLDAVEAERRKDRLVLEEYRKQCQYMFSKVNDMQAMLKAAETHALYASPAPTMESLQRHVDEPRPMSIPELEWVQKTLETKIKQNDNRLPILTQIMQVTPNAEGELVIDFVSATPYKQWQLYYFLRHKQVIRRIKMSPRAQAVSENLQDMQVSSLRVLPATREELQQCTVYGTGQTREDAAEDAELDWEEAEREWLSSG